MTRQFSSSILLIAFTTLFITRDTFGQDISDLDTRYGFKTLKFGTQMKDFTAPTIVPVGWGGADSVVRCLYLPANSELKQVFDKTFDDIYLVFDREKKLVGIQLIKKFSNSGHYQAAFEELKPIITNFRQLFGGNTSTINDSYSGKMGCIWAGKKVLLQVFTNRLGLTEGSENKVEIFDLNFSDKKISSGF